MALRKEVLSARTRTAVCGRSANRQRCFAATPKRGLAAISRRATPKLASVAHSSVDTLAAPYVKNGTERAPAASATTADVFAWERNWWPVMPLAALDPTRPTPIELLGMQLVVWQDGSGTWRCFQDACPHRLVPLSEGRVEGGQLMCSYHGWKFSGEGSCTSIPQAPDSKAQAVAVESPRSCATALPTQEAGGLLWVWPEVSKAAWANSAEAAPLMCNAIKEGRLAQKLPKTWFMRDLPYGFDVLVENLVDPSHLPFSHHKLFPSLNRYKAPPMPFHTAAEGFSPDSVDACAQPPVCTFEFPSALDSQGRVSFHAPGLVTYINRSPVGQTVTNLYAVPRGPGRSRIFTGVVSSDLPPFSWKSLLQPSVLSRLLVVKVMRSLPIWALHLSSQKLFDGDTVFLHGQGRLLQAAKPQGAQGRQGSSPQLPAWASAYFMPMSCDRAVVGMRKWIDSIGGGGPSYAAEAAPEAHQMSRRELLDRYGQHTQQCPDCRSGLALVSRLLSVSKAVMAAAFLGLCGLAGQFGVTRLGGGGLPTAATLAAVMVGVVAAWLGRVCTGLEQQFIFTDHSHADNH